MKERKIITKTTLHEIKVHVKKNGKVHITIFSDKRKVGTMDFWEQKKIFFNAGSLQKDDFSLVFTKLS